MEGFIKEIHVVNSSTDNVDINIEGNTANAQYIWRWKSSEDKVFIKNKSQISLKLKKNGDNWEIFQIKGMSSPASAETSGAESKQPSMPATTYCQQCKEAVGPGHICDITYFCYDCEKEVGDEHICGVTSFCRSCKEEAGKAHVCGSTSFCFNCEKEMPKGHSHSNPGKKSYKTKPINYCNKCEKWVEGGHNCNYKYYFNHNIPIKPYTWSPNEYRIIPIPVYPQNFTMDNIKDWNYFKYEDIHKPLRLTINSTISSSWYQYQFPKTYDSSRFSSAHNGDFLYECFS